MPIFRTNQNIFKDFGEVFDENWMNHDTLQLPEYKIWDYSRELDVIDVDVWEVLYETGEIGVYASWMPYAEFYMVVQIKDQKIETFYGQKSQERLKKFLMNFGIKLNEKNIWVDEEYMYLY